MTDQGSSLDNFGTTSASSGGQSGNGNYSDPTLPIIFGDNVTYTQETLVAGTSQIALLPKAFVVSPAGDDTDFWAEVPECGVVNRADATVANGWTVDIANADDDVYGARMTGGGFGGAVVMLAQPGRGGAAGRRIARMYAERSGRVPTLLVPAD